MVITSFSRTWAIHAQCHLFWANGSCHHCGIGKNSIKHWHVLCKVVLSFSSCWAMVAKEWEENMIWIIVLLRLTTTGHTTNMNVKFTGKHFLNRNCSLQNIPVSVSPLLNSYLLCGSGTGLWNVQYAPENVLNQSIYIKSYNGIHIKTEAFVAFACLVVDYGQASNHT